MKIIKVIFIVLIFITIIELGYYFSLQYINKPKNDSIQDNQTPTRYETINAVHPDFYKYTQGLVTTKKNTLGKVLLVIQNEGEIVEIDPDGNQGPKADRFPFGLKIKSEDNPEGDWNHIAKDFLKKTKVYLVKNNIETLVDLSDIKIGNYVILQDMSNMAYSPKDPKHMDAFIIKIISKNN
ncbi:hypothetical protein A3D78_01455 [Candidatus Gottesmanbacteria bacterium RIFCSPHIGHO2_02_FULL_39_14]|uniref:Uncharacterized protein n=1 Tax=Candidatus Gottesmanbacteria bacterium RIFCSPHIGHO2_02_FULL_39_14 TaxID=1798383 RepID=A0A1F5ZWN4_9BACT|nr:MAG: hypothetical protein A3D78_01455 [Candidatus Gottesmanbacteria bacterium RIFCSPHIGHO2_02_FULL_39_14]